MSIDILNILIVVGVILFSMTLHEAMHAFISYWLGDDTAKLQGRLTLNPIKHIDPFLTLILPLGLAIIGAPIFGGAKPVPFRPDQVRGGEWGAALVAVGGPLTNLVLSFIFFGVWATIGAPMQGIGAQILLTAVSVNLGFFIFNMLPVPPLDGSRVIYALAPEFIRKVMRKIEQAGLLVIFVIVIIASPVLGMLIGSVGGAFIDLFTAIFRL